MKIEQQIYTALDNAFYENQYPHEYNRPEIEIVLEINDWSGIEGFDVENFDQLQTACKTIACWRTDNPKKV
jgi:hypothetical protein